MKVHYFSRIFITLALKQYFKKNTSKTLQIHSKIQRCCPSQNFITINFANFSIKFERYFSEFIFFISIFFILSENVKKKTDSFYSLKQTKHLVAFWSCTFFRDWTSSTCNGWMGRKPPPVVVASRKIRPSTDSAPGPISERQEKR